MQAWRTFLAEDIQSSTNSATAVRKFSRSPAEARLLRTRGCKWQRNRVCFKMFLKPEAMGVLIGFAWERCFDVAVDATAEEAGLRDASDLKSSLRRRRISCRPR